MTQPTDTPSVETAPGSTYEAPFESVPKDLRDTPRGNWAQHIQAISNDDQTIFVPKEHAAKAKGSLVQAMRLRNRRLRSKRTIWNNQEGTAFWSEPK